MSIEWKNDWARWRARDENGELYEYDLKPHARGHCWVTAERLNLIDFIDRSGHCPHWRDTLEARLVESGEPHAENRRLYSIDEAEFGTEATPQYWQIYDALEGWETMRNKPTWIKSLKYRRDPSAPAQPSEDWVDAPECANYRTVDARNYREWWTRKPETGVISWFAKADPTYGVGERVKTELHGDWDDSLESRPTEAWFNLMRGEPEAGADGWIAWPGGDMPVDGDTLVDVRLRDGKEALANPAKKLRWYHHTIATLLAEKDIVKYRLAQPAPKTQSEPYAESHDDGTLTGASLHRAIADAIDAGEGPAVFQVDRYGGGFETALTWSQIVMYDKRGRPIRRKPAMRSATLPNGEVVEWPAPMTTEPEEGSAVWVTCDTSSPHEPWYWYPHSAPELVGWLESGFCHATREARDQAERAFVALNRGTTDAD